MKTTALLIDDLDAAAFDHGLEPQDNPINWYPEGNLYFSNNGGVMGPFTVPQARRMWRDQTIGSLTQVCWEGEDEWWEAGHAAEYFGDSERDRTIRGIGYILAGAGLFFLPVDWVASVFFLPPALAIFAAKGIRPAPRG